MNDRFKKNISTTANFFLDYQIIQLKKRSIQMKLLGVKMLKNYKISIKFFIYSQTINRPMITAQKLHDLLLVLFDLKVSESTINRYRNKGNLHYRPRLRSVYITENVKILRKNFTD